MSDEQVLLAELGRKLGNYERGEKNSITDIAGVLVGHLTVNEDIRGDPASDRKIRIRTGLTVVLPYPMEKEMRLFMDAYILRGGQEATGYQITKDFCYLNSPIALTNGFDVGAVYDAILSYGFNLGRSEIWPPFVQGIDDSFLNGMSESRLDEKEILDVFRRASGEHAQEGSVGIGMGLRAFDAKGGIGTASRKVSFAGSRPFHIGVLAAAGHGNRERYGCENSLTVLAAVDIPLVPYQIKHITKGLVFALPSALMPTAHTDSVQSVLFTTANPMSMENEGPPVFDFRVLDDSYLPDITQAGSEALHEAILRSLIKAAPVRGKDGRICETIKASVLEKIIGGLE